MSSRTPSPQTRARRSRGAARLANMAGGSLGAILVKIVLLGLVDALGIFALFMLATQHNWIVFAIVAAALIAINYIYFSKRTLAMKYLTPGLIFLLVFQVFVIGYTGYISFTNYGSGHNSTKEDAVTALMQSAQERVPDSATYALTVVRDGGDFGFLVTDPKGEVSYGTAEHPLERVTNATMTGDKATGLPGKEALNFTDIVDNQKAIVDLQVPVSSDPNDGALRTPDGSSAFLYLSSLRYDAHADTMTDTKTGTVYSDTGVGAFADPAGKQLKPGWSIGVGFDNYVKAITDDGIRGPLIGVTIWTFVFALLSVLTTFALGLFLAIVFNDMRMKGRAFYRVLIILPYAFPSFLGALVWAGLLNRDFGFINLELFGGAHIPWLTDALLGKISILFVNLWLGFPYMFLVCMGALQSIPDDVQEAAKMDGANPFQIFKKIKLPLLLVSVAPLLISSFAFNFNNFNLVYMLTGGGPRDASASINVGGTDILISMVYKVAFVGADRDYGLASAFSILIFIVVAIIAIVSFRQTKALEELN
ncbi:ABC transporter permease subunit [Mycetocola lacteus]|uniref:Maltose/maltodextrin transport system permease protein n=1 Tax=Mycetocola lacteus TaxID=76637 RepID=A0A3L7AW96_9MICO|nr:MULTISPECIES: ABC transporter permease subunit [Mycetocola]MCS4277860.1 arabinogalactan oligomer/maltooligosaccharide transport system permease protein [Mycetocola sp. BIGb0189]RLP83808.1 ABC transporter permease subunit [Mycetocola lacteus]